MGDTIPHGDRLHEYSEACHEAKVLKVAHADARLINGLVQLTDDYGALGVGRTLLDMFPAIKEVLYMEPVTAKDFEWSPAEDFGAPGVGSKYAQMASYLTHPPEQEPTPVLKMTYHSSEHLMPEVIRLLDGNGGEQRYVPEKPTGTDTDACNDANPFEGEPVRAIMHDGVDVDYGDQGYRVEAHTDLARRILRVHLPATMELFLRRNAEYGDDNDFDLGVQGQYVDISRKVQKLKRRWWDGVEARDGEESDETIVMELIGHLLMSLDYMDQERGKQDSAG